jgi:peptidoglycan/LPS O-acetylase OafA/YrhL
MQTASMPPATRARFEVGDSLRALAALGVVAVHLITLAVTQTGYGPRLGANPGSYFASLFGPLGYAANGLLSAVDLFFVLSGYLLARPFLRAYIADDPLPSIPAYIRNRGLRILPAFWFVLLVAMLFGGAFGDPWLDRLRLAGFVGDYKTAGLRVVIGQAWSLSVEVRFYLLLPLAAVLLYGLKRWLGPVLRRPARIALLLVLLTTALLASQHHASLDPVGAGFASNAQFFAPGILLALLEHVLPGRVRGRRWIGRLAALLFVFGIGLLLASYNLGLRAGEPWHWDYVMLAAGAAVAGPLLWQWTGRSAWHALDNRPLRWIGERSYPLFLIHGLVFYMLAPHLLLGGYKVTLLVLGSVGVTVALVCSDLIHRYVEKPALRFKHREADASGGRLSGRAKLDAGYRPRPPARTAAGGS